MVRGMVGLQSHSMRRPKRTTRTPDKPSAADDRDPAAGRGGIYFGLAGGLAIGAGVVWVVLIFQQFARPAAPRSMGAAAVRAAVTDAPRGDRLRIAALYRQMADLIEDDGQRGAPVLIDGPAVLDALWRIGHLQIGTGWRIGQRYPDLPAAIAAELDAAGLRDETDALEDSARAKIADACRTIAGSLE